jgi:formate dehydrogenase major subunit
MSELINITLNGNKLKVLSGETILNVCLEQGIDIPHLCHDPKLKPFSSCFVCVVEIKGFKSHQPSCSTIVQDGMEIYTDTHSVRKSRKMALELMLSNHYADCLAPCTQTCPAGVDIQGYLSLTEKGLFQQAVELIKETNPLPAICGRVCVRPCEDKCRRQYTEEGSPVGIDYLKRFVSDFDLVSESPVTPKVKESKNKKVAIIGSGPAGLTAAYYLQIEGIQADIYEKAEGVGGWLRYGIPEYRLPNAIVNQEVANITKLGVQIFTQQELGGNLQYETLDKNYDAIFLAIGAQNGDLLGIGEKPAPNLVSGIDFLKKNALTNNDLDLSEKKVVVVGGGNTAMDCCRSARRCGSENVIVLYRRTEADMPANPIEIHESKLEGVEYIFLAAPIDVYYDENGNLTGLKCIKMKAEKLPGSRRSNIVPIEGSEFDLPCDLVLPATGQKIQYEVLEHINQYYPDQDLHLNKWKTLDADEFTMQMNISKIFAAGDAVTGPTNIIQAIAGGKKAARYLTQFVLNQPFEIPKNPFVSTKDSFTPQNKELYLNQFEYVPKNEMPVLDAQMRDNFKEVELGYANLTEVQNEVSRCLECGCVAFYECDLQKYATEYEAVQTHYMGGYQVFERTNAHEKFELDNHKCILCGRCVRVCKEYSGNRVWEFFKRGSKTYISVNMENDIGESRCDACGLCIDTCPTGALTENFSSKILPAPYEKLPIIDPFGSEGFEANLLMYKGNIYGATARTGIVNHKGLINRELFFGYSVFNKSNRIKTPMVRIDGKLVSISIEKALEIIKKAVRQVNNHDNILLVSPEMTNEAMYMIQKWGRVGLQTNTIGSPYFINRSKASNLDKNDILPLQELEGSKHIFVLGGDLPKDHPVISHLVQNHRFFKNGEVTFITTEQNHPFSNRTDHTLNILDMFYFIKAVSHYLVHSEKMFGIFVNGLAKEWNAYREAILKCNYEELLLKAGVDNQTIEKFAQLLINIPETAFILSEKNTDEKTMTELKNLMLLTEKQGKTFSGMVVLKPACNTQGLFDMGIYLDYGPGFRKMEGSYLELLKNHWHTSRLSTQFMCPGQALQKGSPKNLFIFGLDLINDTPELTEMIKKASFICVQSLFENETTEIADLVLPMNFAIEIGGSFTSSFKVAQNFQAVKKSKINWNDYQFYAELHAYFDIQSPKHYSEIFLEMISLLQPSCCSDNRHCFVIND